MNTEVVNFSVRRQADGLWVGEIIIPIAPRTPSGQLPSRGQAVAVKAADGSKAGALQKAAGIAEQIATNPLVQAVLPPGSGAAISAIKMIASSGVAEGMTKVVGAGAKRLADALKFW